MIIAYTVATYMEKFALPSHEAWLRHCAAYLEMKEEVTSVKATLNSLNKGVAVLSEGVSFLLQAQGLVNPLHGPQGMATTLSGMLVKVNHCLPFNGLFFNRRELSSIAMTHSAHSFDVST